LSSKSLSGASINAIKFAGESASAKEEIERQYDQRRRAIAQREAKAKQKQAIFNIAIDTAQAIVATLAKTPPPAGIPLALLMGAIGAAQIAMVASQKIPQYWKGTDNAEGGLAWTQEKGREIITDKHGNIKYTGSDGGAKLTMLDKGDKVYTAEQTKRMMFDDNLNSILFRNNINSPKLENKPDYLVANKIDSLIKAVNNKETSKLTIDKSGFRTYVKMQGQTTQILNNRITLKGNVI